MDGEPQEEDISEINKKYEVVHAKHLPIIPKKKRMDEYLTQLYYNPKRSGSLGGVERLYRDVKKEGKYDISRAQLKKWLMKQDTYTFTQTGTSPLQEKSRIVGGIDELWQMDLADMQAHAAENDGYRYFSKYVWVIPLKTKTGPALVTAFKKILESGVNLKKYKRMRVLNFSINISKIS